MGLDVGLTSFAVLSDGTVIDNPRYARQAQARQALLFLYREFLHRELGTIPVRYVRPAPVSAGGTGSNR